MTLTCTSEWKRVQKAVLDGCIMREGPADWDEDLNAWFSELEDVVQEIMEDPIFKDNQKYTAAADGRRGSNIYEVNLWMWSFARGKPLLGGLSVEKTFERQVAAGEASKESAAETRRRRKAGKA